MHLSTYEYKTNETFLDYEFVSIGPKGKVKKLVRFTQINNEVYNLAFGDLNEETGEINDLVVTDNRDSRKVLATVANTIYDFYEAYLYAKVFIKGSTPARTRLYRMGITIFLEEISMDFEIYGLKNRKWETFRVGTDYEAFLIEPKEVKE